MVEEKHGGAFMKVGILAGTVSAEGQAAKGMLGVDFQALLSGVWVLVGKLLSQP